GLAILAGSRPFEGLIVSLPIAMALFAWLVSRNRPGWRTGFVRVVLPLGAVLGLTATALAAYNARLTGKPLLMPYQQNGMTYGVTPLFLWQPLQPVPDYHHAVMRDYHLEWAVPA